MKGFLHVENHDKEDGTTWEALVVDAVGNVIEFWGFKRNQGRVWALIFVRGTPMSALEIQDALQLSKGAVSMLTRELERWEVLRRVRLPSSSSWRFDVETDLKRMITNVLREREGVFISRVRADLEEAENLAREQGAPDDVVERIQRMRSLADAMGKALDLFLSSATLSLVKMVDVLRTRNPLAKKRKGKERE
ncbi:MAG: transcriptional regulator [Deltaproteobacteria bacterium]|nr:transcriptional regulator [Deltaproteobacteria bacterium]